jgi:hypothetical protein
MIIIFAGGEGKSEDCGDLVRQKKVLDDENGDKFEHQQCRLLTFIVLSINLTKTETDSAAKYLDYSSSLFGLVSDLRIARQFSTFKLLDEEI